MDSQALMRHALTHPARLMASTLLLRAHAHILGSVLMSVLSTAAIMFTLVFLPFVSLPFAHLERARIWLLTGNKMVNAHLPKPNEGVRSWALLRIGEAATWREATHFIVALVLGFFIATALAVETVFVVSLAGTPFVALEKPVQIGSITMQTPLDTWPLFASGIFCLIIFAYINTLIAFSLGCITEKLLGAGDHELLQKVCALDQSRTVILDSFDAERRRIERDLHDGVQQRLVNSALTLGMMKRQLSDGPAAALVLRAIKQNQAALASLRETILGISPPVLADHGLIAALRSLIDASSLDVTLVLDNREQKCDPSVELAAYYIVSEALTNIVKHSGTLSATVKVGGKTDMLTVTVTDCGSGGANPAAGKGLAGLAERALALGGTLRIKSDTTGTTITASLPRSTPSEPASRSIPS